VAVHGLHIVEPAMGERVLVMGAGAIGLLSVRQPRRPERRDHRHVPARAPGSGGAAAARTALMDGETGGLEKAASISLSKLWAARRRRCRRRWGLCGRAADIGTGVFTQPVQLNALGLMLKEVKMAGGITYCRPSQHSDFDTALGILESQPERARAIITHRFALDEAADAFATAANKGTGAIKVQVQG
jgi:threonine dehydrogenase-like Zn-dependent dehydrogenase